MFKQEISDKTKPKTQMISTTRSSTTITLQQDEPISTVCWQQQFQENKECRERERERESKDPKITEH